MPVPHTVDTLEPEIRDLFEKLLKRRRGVDEFTTLANSILEERGSDVRLSRSSAHRFMQGLAEERQAMRETQEAMAAFGRDIGEIPETDSGVVLAEMLRTMMYKVIRPRLRGEKEALDAQDIMLLSRSLRDTMATVKGSVETALKIREEFAKEAAKTAGAAAKKAGISEAARLKIEEEILGLVRR